MYTITMGVLVPLGTTFVQTSPGQYSYLFAHLAGVGYSATLSNGVNTLTFNSSCTVSTLTTSIDDVLNVCGEPGNTISLAGSSTGPGTVVFTINGTPVTVFNPSLYPAGDTVRIRVRFTPSSGSVCPQTYEYPIVIDTNICPPYEYASLGDKVWLDVNANGLQDGGLELGIPGVIVKLLNDLNVVVARDTTDANGIYGFPNLSHGVAYRVDFDAPSGYTQSTDNTGPDNLDSDAEVNGITDTYILNPGENNTTMDAGFNCNASLTFPPIYICGVQQELI